MGLVRRLWADEAGFIISAELCLVATIVVIGLIVGLVTLRNQVVQELIAVGEAIGSINTSYAFTGLQTAHGGIVSWTGASSWTDYVHFCHPTAAEQGDGLWEGGIITIAASEAQGRVPSISNLRLRSSCGFMCLEPPGQRPGGSGFLGNVSEAVRKGGQAPYILYSVEA